MTSDVPIYESIWSVLLQGCGLAFVVWLCIRALRQSDRPGVLIFKLIVTALILGSFIRYIKPDRGPAPDLERLIVAAFGGLTLAALWRHSIVAVFARPFAALYDGGDMPAKPQPFYSIAEAHRKRGHYTEAIAEIRRQLAKFPDDFEGQMMLASVQAENLNDLPGAELTIQRLCSQSSHPPRNIAFALNSLADWHLKYAQDREAASQDLQKIIDLYPETELALAAAQRIAHLAKTEQLLEPHDRRPIPVPEGVKNVGLLQSSEHLRPAEINPDELVANYVKHLEQYPLDTEAREKLAVLYADHYGELNLATDQLEQLIELPNQPAKNVAHWLNLLADLQVRHGADYDTVRQTLERIVEKYPNLAVAEMARTRLARLRLEFKSKEKSQAVKLGSYEQNIGLKQGLPR